MALIFEWDPKKAVSNLRKHGIRFEEAATVFADPCSLTIHDPDQARSTKSDLSFLGFPHAPGCWSW